MNCFTEKIYDVQRYKHEIYDGSYRCKKELKRLEKQAEKYAEIYLDPMQLNPKFNYSKLISFATFIMDMERLYFYHNYPEDKKDKLMADIKKQRKTSRFENPDVYEIIMTLDECNTTVTFHMYEESETVDAEEFDTVIDIKMISKTGRKLESGIKIINDQFPKELEQANELDSSLLYERFKTIIEYELFAKLQQLFLEYLYR